MPDQPRIELHDQWLRLHFGAEAPRHADYHYRWLRHNSDGDRHPTTGERLLCSSELPDRLTAQSAELVDGVLLVTWSDRRDRRDRRQSRYPLTWLREHAYATERAAPPAPPNALARYEFFSTDDDLEVLAVEALQRVRSDGMVVVRHPREQPENETEPLVAAFERTGVGIVETHFGRIEDLRTDNTTNRNTDQLGYTDAAIQLHTDQPFLDRPPRYQILQSIRQADQGGENFLVDARAASAYFQALDARDHELLTSTPVRFLRQQKAFVSEVVSPILVLDGPRGFQIRYSYFTMAPHRVSFERMGAWYRSYDAFARLCRDERHQLRFRLAPGDFVLYDNLRMLHARTGFSGPRWVRGIYLDE